MPASAHHGTCARPAAGAPLPIALGLLVPVDPGPLPPPEARPLGRAALRLRAELGVDVLFGDTLRDGHLVGLRPVPGGWRPAEGPVAAVHDRFPGDGRPAAWAALHAGGAGLPWGNPPALTRLCRDKLDCQRALEAAGLPGLPPVEADPARFPAALAAWGAAFLKPRAGSFGAGVRRVTADAPGGLPATLPTAAPGRADPALLQRAVPPPPGLAGRCLRALVQRQPEGAWALAPMVVRESAQDPVVNAARGAGLRPADEVLPADALAACAALALAAARALAAAPGCGDAVELGVDLVLDPDHRPWLVEVNARAQGRLEALAPRGPAWAAAHDRAVEAPLRALLGRVQGRWAGG